MVLGIMVTLNVKLENKNVSAVDAISRSTVELPEDDDPLVDLPEEEQVSNEPVKIKKATPIIINGANIVLTPGNDGLVIMELNKYQLTQIASGEDEIIIDLTEHKIVTEKVKLAVLAGALTGKDIKYKSISIVTDGGIFKIPTGIKGTMWSRLNSSDRVEISIYKEYIMAKITVNEKPFEWYEYKNPIVVIKPYEKTPDAIYDDLIAVSVKVNGEDRVIPTSRYKDGYLQYEAIYSGDYKAIYNNPKFIDIKGNWYETPVTYMAARRVVQGVSKGKFAPNEFVRRGDFVVMLMKTFSIGGLKADTFSDVSEDSYYYDGITSARALGVINGVENNNFKPDELITRQDMFVMFTRTLKALGKITETEVKNAEFADIKKLPFYVRNDISLLLENKLISGSDNMIKGSDKATRAETIQLLYNYVVNLNFK